LARRRLRRAKARLRHPIPSRERVNGLATLNRNYQRARHGFEVLTAADGREGVEVFGRHALSLSWG